MNDTPAPGPREFTTTHWSLVGAAQPDEASQTRARMALEELCRTYWYPLYVFVRNRGYAPADAQDLTQSFFARFIETGGFAAANRRRGRFRTYLLGAVKHFLANEWHRARTQKRGGGVIFLEWDTLDPEGRYALESAQPTDPEIGFDREWALALVARAKEKLRAEYETGGKGELFAALKASLGGEHPTRNEAVSPLGLSDGALKVAIHRLRQRYRDHLRAEIAETVATRKEIDEEMRYLVAVLRGQ